jgi:hypothetical protein
MHTLATAAAAVGRNKTAIGEWQIDPAELHRIYPP